MKDLLKTTFHRLIKELNIDTHRYLYEQFNINNRLTGIVGPRGVGKTTMMLQYIKNNLYKTNKVIYFSADHICFSKTTIFEFIDDLYHTEGINIIFIDEIHKYKNWQQELKNIYDSFPAIKIIFSGSSSLDIIKGSYDLSRRAKMHYLHGLSFREYINFGMGVKIPAIPLEDLIADPKIYDSVFANISGIKGHFNKYLTHGYYPFLFEDELSYYEKIIRVVDKTIYEDIANYYNLKTANLIFFRKILNFLATTPPVQINTYTLAKNLGADSKTILNYLFILHNTGLIRFIFPFQRGNKLLRKPEKMFLHNTALLSVLTIALGQNIDKGTERELFFLQSLAGANTDAFYSEIGDFHTKDYVFEIGGKNKGAKQLKNAKKKSILIKDNIYTSSKNVIPLHYFGFLY